MTEQRDDLLNVSKDGVVRLAANLAERGLVAPAIVALEMSRPFGFILAQALMIIEPMCGEKLRYRLAAYARLLQDDDEMDRLEHLLESAISASVGTEEDPCQPSLS